MSDTADTPEAAEVQAETAPPAEEAPKPAKVKSPRVFGSSAPKCKVCTKSVYKAEEIKYDNQIWHKA